MADGPTLESCEPDERGSARARPVGAPVFSPRQRALSGRPRRPPNSSFDIRLERQAAALSAFRGVPRAAGRLRRRAADGADPAQRHQLVRGHMDGPYTIAERAYWPHINTLRYIRDRSFRRSSGGSRSRLPTLGLNRCRAAPRTARMRSSTRSTPSRSAPLTAMPIARACTNHAHHGAAYHTASASTIICASISTAPVCRLKLRPSRRDIALRAHRLNGWRALAATASRLWRAPAPNQVATARWMSP